MKRLLLAVLLAATLSAPPSAAQRRTELLPGTRVRVTMPVFVDGVAISRVERPAVGTVVSVDSVSITTQMEDEGPLLTVPFSAIARLQVSRGAISSAEGQRRGLRKGMLIGGGAAVTAYAVLYLIQIGSERLAESNCDFELLECEQDSDPELPYMVPAIAASTVGGALIGMTLGKRERERWDDVHPRSLRPAAPREVALLVSVAF